jgi:hypothetical protein
MRELSNTEIFEVGGGVLTFTTPLTMSVMNNVATAGTVGSWVGASFTAGYYVGSYLNGKFNISTKIVDFLTK